MQELSSELDESKAEEFSGRIFNASIEALDVLGVYIGDRLGLYRALSKDGPATVDELEERTQIDPRYAREWLEQQAVSGYLEVDDVSLPQDQRRYALSAEHAAAVVDPDNPFSVAPLARALVSVAQTLPKVLEAFRTGGGVPWEDYGPDGIESQGDFNRPWLVHQFGTEYLPSIPDVHERLQADPPARVADVACGVGWASIAIAKAYPKAVVEGFDLDESSIAIARQIAADTGLDDRVRFEVRDVANRTRQEPYDLVVMIESLHDLSQPVPALVAIEQCQVVETDGKAWVLLSEFFCLLQGSQPVPFQEGRLIAHQVVPRLARKPRHTLEKLHALHGATSLAGRSGVPAILAGMAQQPGGPGDGGGGGDLAQDITNQLLGKILRIDVDGDDFPADPNRNYALPVDNPFVGVTGDDEIWAYGLRNPWRPSFDRATGDLYIADVGQSSWEEINFQPAASTCGENYGWGCWEGNHPFNLVNCPAQETMVFQIHEYSHLGGHCSIIGGYVYRGCAIPTLSGTYFFADFCSNQIWSFTYTGGMVTNFTDRTAELDPVPGSIDEIVSFGEDAKGEMYIVEQGFVSNTGEVFKIVSACPTDINGDGAINVLDLIDLLLNFGVSGCAPTDVNDDGVTNVLDLIDLLLAFGTACP